MTDQELAQAAAAAESEAPEASSRSRVLTFTAAAIERARRFAADLIDRLVRTAGPGEHFVACVTRRVGPGPRVHAGIVIVRPTISHDAARPRARISETSTRRGFAALLMFGRLAEEPVGLIMRSCADVRHYAPEHSCVTRGWVAQNGRAVPLRRGTVWNLAGGPLGPHPGLPPHPQETIEYETAYSLYPDK